MDKLVVQGPTVLRGSLPISGSKNTALPLMAGALLAPGVTHIEQVPDLRDIHTFSHILRISGAPVRFDADAHRLTVDASTISYPEAPYELVKKMRASFYMLGALIGRCGKARVSLPGGCAWGPRPVDLHLKGMEALGASIDLEEGYVVARTPGGRLPGGTFHMEPSSVGATVNLMLAAVLARGGSRIENAAREPDVVVFGEALQQLGAQIDGLGTTTIEIQGVDALEPATIRNCPDRIELGTFMIAAALAGQPGEAVHFTDANADHLGDAFLDAFRATGAHVDLADDVVSVTAPDRLRAVSIETAPYPGFPTDLQAQWSILLTQAEGAADVVDTIYADRFKHIPELQRMGLKAQIDGNTVHIEGPQRLKSATVMSSDLRASVSLVLAGMVAEGETHVLRVYHLDRGYERLEDKLSATGVAIRREQYDEFAMPDVGAEA